MKIEMNQKLQNIFDIIQQSDKLDTEQKDSLLKAVKDADKELEITAFKLERTEKVKKTTAILLEETIEELEQKRKAVEAQNHELEIETALEKVRTIAMAMRKPDDMLDVCKTISQQLESLGVKEIRNVQTAIFYQQRGTYMNYEFYAKHDKTIVTETTYTNNKLHEEFANKMMKGKGEIFITHIKGDEVKDWIAYQKTTNVFIDKYLETASSLNYYWFSLGPVALGISTYHPLTEVEINLFKRFLKVFELAYQRYLDIEKAEAQAREAQIELALERIRARTMAMHKSDELLDTAVILSKELIGLSVSHFMSGFVLVHESLQKQEGWLGVPELESKQRFFLPLTGDSVLKERFKSWKKGEQLFFQKVRGKKLTNHLNYVSKYFESEEAKENVKHFPDIVFFYCGNFKEGYLHILVESALNKEQEIILSRFTKVFQQTYTRFLDLQKAEAQGREAQIEVALERVRSRTMGMQKSEELKEVIKIVYQQLIHLQISVDHAGFVVDYKPKGDWTFWIADEQDIPSKISHPYFESVWAHQFDDAKEIGIDFFATNLNFEEKNKFYNELLSYVPGLPEASKDFYLSCPGLAATTVLFNDVSLYIENFSGTPYSDEENKILIRFGKVFQQTYTRFLDLKKAEVQAREAQIEVALERIRARAMAMHTSDELMDVAGILREQMGLLGQPELETSVINLFEENSDQVLSWHAFRSPELSSGKIITGAASFSWDSSAISREMMDAYRSGQQEHTMEADRAKAMELFQVLVQAAPEIAKYAGDSFPERICYHLTFFSGGALLMVSYQPPSEEAKSLQRRAASVFDLAYRRYRDLKKAEAQAREAQIEVSLERVRSKAMAMHSPNDLSETVNVFFKELKTLSIIPIRCGVGQIDEATRTTSLTTTTSSQQGDTFQVIGKIKQTGHPVLDGIFDHWKLQKEYHPVLQGEDIKAYYSVMNPQIGYPEYPEGITQYGNCFYFTEGFVFAWTESKLSEEELQIFRRFTSVLSLTYRRFLDLKEAEARAIEALRQASLDRVRAEIASMRTTEDLNHITPIIWRELKILEVPFIRCGVFIVNDNQSKVQVYLSTPDGKSLGVLSLPIEFSSLTSNSVDYWRKKKVYKVHWSKEQFIKWTKSMIELRQIQNAETYQGSGNPPDSLDLHFIPFAQGMLYVGSISPLNEEKLLLVQTLAEAFSIAYARYEDFRNIEDAKNRIEATLRELKSAQAQLIHSEKMASLGELTAGIAHEIKNPLNFVNNFSDLSRELLDDLKEELVNDNKEEVMAIVNDVKQNLEKINQHGKRADSIVKGMLLHSRGTSGEKVLTNINDLLEQYVTLAYHGMRAQNKEFNITIEKDYDESIEKINIVPQDISRVFLNIINNACYAANERKLKSSTDFSPTLKVSTKNLQDKVEIKIRDNGDGIPKSIREKLFNPFFTTKPTGEGTGLGLSLSYDIVVKQHSGEIKFESEEGKGAEFIIMLPKV